MTEPGQDRPTFMPIAIALAIVVVALGSIWVLRLFRTDEVPDEGLAGRAVVGQNDALQRENYPDFLAYTCIAQQGTETQVLAAPTPCTSAKGTRVAAHARALPVSGGRATGTVVYHFEKSAENKISTPMTFVRENGGWKVCSPGAR